MAPAGGIFAPLAMGALKRAFKKTSNLIKIRFAEISPTSKLRPVLVRNSPRHPLHPVAALRQSKGRWYTTHSTTNAAGRRFMSSGPAPGTRINRAAFPKSITATAVSRLTTRAPFSSTLRPNLTGGTLPRTSGGYSLGGSRPGGARYFSHGPAAPAQVVNNVSAAVRAFWLSGHKAQFDGMNPAGEKKYRGISTLQDKITQKMQSIPRASPGSYIDFYVNPKVTALSPPGAAFGSKLPVAETNLNTEGFLDVLSVDFARVLKDLAATMNDLKRLSSFGDLPITLEQKSILRVRFPGCDAESVERLCDEVGVQRGIICQDEEFNDSAGAQMALLFPYAPASEHTLSSPGGSLRSQTGNELEHEYEYDDFQEDIIENPWVEGYESLEDSSDGESVYFSKQSSPHDSSDYEGLEGIYRFLEQCDNNRRI
ncbi:uncharacterized protein L3040_003217 [Drepanopeziza brunnea f. sp. 'multigermtubi']|uniref:Casein kinase II beta 2 subunit n=1 Tax=Marssonina brunnea f. sp. multigermtubi (strain MB_m1) TaxID=1072389 RepID=K1WS95_MARBU|nr:casein kinase II beta 2 subunit [Drepanopeziza brunnea f. sp. 'multigermtubi' MB_m1]EKD15926.1 casein kinase II beta 2 subunit [Drepanopeziza brunnea f. sp. 'multigermtubi' MB_m1]KAJ5047390.1 hypothetical protein L3040_003217 [Drepanopeziza brunnea f. sp. 'multigermtubi']